MKKFTTLLTMAFIALMSISFTSCDDDSDIAYTLDGTWKGNMLVEYGNQKALYSVIRFDQNDGIYSGTGYWIDYFKGNYWHGNNYIANHITWTASNPQPIGFSGILLAKRQNSFYCTYFLHNRNVADTKSPYPIKRLEVIRWFNQKSMVFNQSLS